MTALLLKTPILKLTQSVSIGFKLLVKNRLLLQIQKTDNCKRKLFWIKIKNRFITMLAIRGNKMYTYFTDPVETNTAHLIKNICNKGIGKKF